MAIESESEVQCRRRLPVRRSKERVEERKREARSVEESFRPGSVVPCLDLDLQLGPRLFRVH